MGYAKGPPTSAVNADGTVQSGATLTSASCIEMAGNSAVTPFSAVRITSAGANSALSIRRDTTTLYQFTGYGGILFGGSGAVATLPGLICTYDDQGIFFKANKTNAAAKVAFRFSNIVPLTNVDARLAEWFADDVGTYKYGLGVAGQPVQPRGGAAGVVGVATLVAGTVTVNTTSISGGNTLVQTWREPGGTPANYGHIYVASKVAATSFTITSTNAADTSVIGWRLIEAP